MTERMRKRSSYASEQARKERLKKATAAIRPPPAPSPKAYPTPAPGYGQGADAKAFEATTRQALAMQETDRKTRRKSDEIARRMNRGR